MPLQLAASMGATELLGVDIDGIGFVRQNTTGLPTRIVRSHWNLGPTLDFAPQRAARNIALGYFDTMRLFGRVGGTAYAILPDQDRFLERFADSYQRLLAAVNQRAPGMDRTEKTARQRAGYPLPYAPNPSAPTAVRCATGTGCRTAACTGGSAYTPNCWQPPLWAVLTRILRIGFPPCWRERKTA